MVDHRSPLRLNLGFLISLSLGDFREYSIDLQEVHLKPDLDLLDIHGSVKFSRTSNGILAHAIIQAMQQTECVRCLYEFPLLLKIDFTELYAFSKNSLTESNLLFPDDGSIDLAPLIREYMILEKPINPLCNPECKGLCPVCGENLNEQSCNHDDEIVDSRLEVLKKMLK